MTRKLWALKHKLGWHSWYYYNEWYRICHYCGKRQIYDDDIEAWVDSPFQSAEQVYDPMQYHT